MQDRPKSKTTAEQPPKPAVLSSSSHPMPEEFQFCGIIALSDTLISRYSSIGTYDLATNQPGPDLEIKADRAYHTDKIALPENKFALIDHGTLTIYCSNTMKFLQTIKLPFTPHELQDDSEFKTYSLYVTSDQKNLVIETSSLTVRKIYFSAGSFVYSPSSVYVDFFIDLQTYQIFRKKRDDNEQKTAWLGDGKYLLFTTGDRGKTPEFNIHSIHSDKVIPCKMSDVKGIARIFTFPQHPSIWLVSMFEADKYVLYLYDVKASDQQYVATRGKKIDVSFRFDDPSLVKIFPHSFVYTNVINLKTNELWEFNLNRMQQQKIEVPGFSKSFMQCIFPDGRLVISAYNAQGPSALITLKLASMREHADQVENELVDAMDSAFISTARPQGMPKPLQRMIAGYACGFFAASDEPVRAATVRERHGIEPELMATPSHTN